MTNTCMTALSSTKTFLQQNFMTAKRIPPSLVKGINVFDVNSHKSGGYRLATLDKPGDFGKIERPLTGVVRYVTTTTTGASLTGVYKPRARPSCQAAMCWWWAATTSGSRARTMYW